VAWAPTASARIALSSVSTSHPFVVAASYSLHATPRRHPVGVTVRP
jgi:hypothetical protein